MRICDVGLSPPNPIVDHEIESSSVWSPQQAPAKQTSQCTRVVQARGANCVDKINEAMSPVGCARANANKTKQMQAPDAQPQPGGVVDGQAGKGTRMCVCASGAVCCARRGSDGISSRRLFFRGPGNEADAPQIDPSPAQTGAAAKRLRCEENNKTTGAPISFARYFTYKPR